MHDDHHHADDALAEKIASIALSPEIQAKSGRLIFLNLARALNAVGDSFVSTNVSEFLTQPRQFEKGHAIVLLNRRVHTPGTWLLHATKQADGSFATAIFNLDETTLSQSGHAELDQRDAEELQRQLKLIDHTGPRLYTVAVLNEPIQGYEYFLTDEEKADLRVQQLEQQLHQLRQTKQLEVPSQTTVESTATVAKPEKPDLSDKALL